MAILQISVVPLGTASTSLSRHLASLPSLLQQSGLNYRHHPMGTVVEGPVPELFRLAQGLHEAGFATGSRRVMTALQIDDRRDLERPMEHKVDSLLAAASEGTP